MHSMSSGPVHTRPLVMMSSWQQGERLSAAQMASSQLLHDKLQQTASPGLRVPDEHNVKFVPFGAHALQASYWEEESHTSCQVSVVPSSSTSSM